MPGAVIGNPTPNWLKPENASVFDPWYVRLARMAGHVIGADDPQSQILALMNPTQVPKGTLGTLGKLGQMGSAKAQVPSGPLKSLKAYHGSPYDFERFDASKIGTGEGAQAYGHGHYFAEAQPVAESYRKIHVGMDADGNLIYPPNMDRSKIYQPSQAIQKQIDDIQGLMDAAQHRGDRPEWERLAATRRTLWKELDDSTAKYGRMYEVAIKADPESFLDWDKPIEQQPPQLMNLVREGLKKQGYLRQNDNGPRQLSAALKAWKMEHGGMTDTAISALLSGRGGLLGETPEAMSATLKQAGITGIKYLDQGSRAAGEGSRNYVVFPGNEHLIDILKKYGIAATAGAGLMKGERQ